VSDPALSVILLCPDAPEMLNRTLASLERQTIADRLEIVIVVPDDGAFDSSIVRSFFGFVLVRSQASTIGAQYAAGIRMARSEIVVLGEDHSFPEANWAEALLHGYALGNDAVGPAIRNENPGSAVSWADLYIAYSEWLYPAVSKKVEHLPGHNSSYKKSLLLGFGEKLEELMEAESVLHWKLRASGHELMLQNEAVTSHMNFEKLRVWTATQFFSGRQFAASRSENESWNILKRAFYAVASPIIPLVRLVRIAREVRAPQRRDVPFYSILPALVYGLTMDAIGQFTGYLFGPGNATQRLVALDFHRERHSRQSALHT
jgi:hypothetical protein